MPILRKAILRKKKEDGEIGGLGGDDFSGIF